MRLLRFTARTNRVTIIAGTALVVLLGTVTGSAYQSSYPSTQARRAAAELARQNPATTAMYGDLAQPGTAKQLFTWEIGSFLPLLAAILGVLLAIAATRTAAACRFAEFSVWNGGYTQAPP